MPKLTVCGGGNAAHVLIALGNQAGWDVDVFTPLNDEVDRLANGIAANDGLSASNNGQVIVGQTRQISSNPADVIPGSALVLLALPAFAHGVILDAIANFLDRGAAIGALPARGGLDYQMWSLLDVKERELRLFGLQTLPWACRIREYGQAVEILGTKKSVDMAVYPTTAAPELKKQLEPLLRLELVSVSSFLVLTLANTGQLIHPGIMYGLCLGQETNTYEKENIPLFYQGVDQFTADVLEAMSDDIQAVASTLAGELSAFNANEVASLRQWLLRSYSGDIANPSTLRSAFVTNRAYEGLRVPVRLTKDNKFSVDFPARYLSEDVPYGLVVSRGIAELAGVPTPTLDKVILWVEEQLGYQYLKDGMLVGADVTRTRAPQQYGIHTLAQLEGGSSQTMGSLNK